MFSFFYQHIVASCEKNALNASLNLFERNSFGQKQLLSDRAQRSGHELQMANYNRSNMKALAHFREKKIITFPYVSYRDVTRFSITSAAITTYR